MRPDMFIKQFVEKGIALRYQYVPIWQMKREKIGM